MWGGVDVGMRATFQKELEVLNDQLQERDRLQEELTLSKETLQLEMEELRAELVLAQTKLKRTEKLEHAAPPTTGLHPAPPPVGLHPAPGTPPITLPVLPEGTSLPPPATSVRPPVTRMVAGPLTPSTLRTMTTTIPMASPLPPMQPFTGEGVQDVDTFRDWHDQFELVACLGGWDDHCKLVNLTARLRGKAHSFYRSCTPTHRSDYPLLVAELKRRFTPVQLTAVQTQLFHERKQGPQESADDFAEELKRLFAKAYDGRSRGTPEAESMGETILANQFVAGLLPGLKSKLVGSEGTLGQLLAKARFEEAKSKELKALTRPPPPMKKPNNGGPLPGTPPKHPAKWLTSGTAEKGDSQNRKCFNCGLTGHMRRDCPYPKQSKGGNEARGRSTVANVTSGKPSSSHSKKRIDELRRQLREAELIDAVEQAAGTLHGVMPTRDSPKSKLGPTLRAPVSVNGVTANALIDTGSPATIISLEFLMQTLVQEKTTEQTPAEWRDTTMKRFSSPKVTLNSYGGTRLDIMAQILVQLLQGNRKMDAVVLVQKGAPNDVLLGTDVQPQLGFSLLMETSEKRVDLLVGEGPMVWMEGVGRKDPEDMPVSPVEKGEGVSTDGDLGRSQPDVGTEQENAKGLDGVVRLLHETRIPPGYQMGLYAYSMKRGSHRATRNSYEQV